MKRIFYLLVAFSAIMPSAYAAQESAKKQTSAVKEEFKNHFGLYGFIRNYFTYDSRESASGTGNLFYYLPFDRDLNEAGEDMNAQSSFRFLAITSRVGLDVSGYRVGRTDISAKVETDFYAGLSGSTGTATLRLRQAYMKLGWKDLPMGSDKASVSLLMGQAWHPLAADQPDVISLAVGAPFNAFNRSPQVTMDANLGDHVTISASMIYQMQYTSTGPDGSSANYMKYGLYPEGFASVTVKSGGFLLKGGVSYLNIKPVHEVKTTSGSGTVTDRRKAYGRMSAFSPFLYMQIKHKSFTFKAKSIYGGASDYLNLVSGYGITAFDDQTCTFTYAPTYVSSSWFSMSVGKKVQGMLMGGYFQNMGASRDFLDLDDNYFFFSKDGGNFKHVARAYRIVPAIVLNFGKFSLGLEYEMTSAQYGDNIKDNGMVYTFETLSSGEVVSASHWITNHRVQLMTRFTF